MINMCISSATYRYFGTDHNNSYHLCHLAFNTSTLKSSPMPAGQSTVDLLQADNGPVRRLTDSLVVIDWSISWSITYYSSTEVTTVVTVTVGNYTEFRLISAVKTIPFSWLTCLMYRSNGGHSKLEKCLQQIRGVYKLAQNCHNDSSVKLSKYS
jgi:hypothetical protein